MPTAAQNRLSESTTYRRNDDDKTLKNCNLAYSTTQVETAQYIADMVLELRNMAKSTALYATMVPLEYAYYEAFSVANRVEVPKHEVERLNRLGDEAKRASEPAV